MVRRLAAVTAPLALVVALTGCSAPRVDAVQITGLPTELPAASIPPDDTGSPEIVVDVSGVRTPVTVR